MANTRKSREEGAGRIIVSKDGPYLVRGGLPLAKEYIVADDAGISVEWRQGEAYPRREAYALCRCGGSKARPYCDGTHARAGFDGTETASRAEYASLAEHIEGPGFTLTDVPDLCARARFCHQAGGIWRLAEESDDPADRTVAARIAGQCPSGRLAVVDGETGEPIEPGFRPSIGVTEDPPRKASGPLWVKGGVPVESEDGTRYETRSRVTLCRCGQSGNKPFCDGSHIDCGFNDGDPRL